MKEEDISLEPSKAIAPASSPPGSGSSSFFSFYSQFWTPTRTTSKDKEEGEKELMSDEETPKETLTDEAILDEIRNHRDAQLKRDLAKLKNICVPDPDPFDVFPAYAHPDGLDRERPPAPMAMEREKAVVVVEEEGAREQIVPYKTVSAPSWLARTTDTVKYSLISRQTEATLNEIIALVQKFFADVNVSYADMVFGLLLLKVHPGNQTVRTEIPVERRFISDAHYYMKFAAAVYGWKLIYGYVFKKQTAGLYKGFIEGDKINPKVLVEHTGIKTEDIIVAKWKSSDFDPGHYMVYDHSRGTIVIAIRGTFHIRDALTDLVAAYEPFMGGYAHRGILLTARRKLDSLKEQLVASMEAYPDYGVVVVGHSLGAGTASLLSLLIQDEFPDKTVRCHAFACPCVLSLDLATRCRDTITSYVLGDDIIPRLSYGSLEDLKKTIAALLAQEKSTVKRVFQVVGLAKPNVQAILEQEEKRILAEKLWPPGQIYHIYLTPNKAYQVEESSPSLFGQIIISSRMFLDHMPDLYEAALQDLLDNWYDSARLSELKAEKMLRDLEFVASKEDTLAKELYERQREKERQRELEEEEERKKNGADFTPLGYFPVVSDTKIELTEKEMQDHGMLLLDSPRGKLQVDTSTTTTTTTTTTTLSEAKSLLDEFFIPLEQSSRPPLFLSDETLTIVGSDKEGTETEKKEKEDEEEQGKTLWEKEEDEEECAEPEEKRMVIRTRRRTQPLTKSSPTTTTTTITSTTTTTTQSTTPAPPKQSSWFSYIMGGFGG